ncbi:disease resistance protein PIK6-NP-like [Lolium rigidum]|uniref:disease resistance protein PIK6-NP-like n=1 Tax=Lolium rigidum TaxID=89674 RepID=UPI001F5CDDA6|nr:disease resistance protein PIK6-NP-like [Lolium rigidum]
MDLATGAMGSLLVKLDDLLTQEYKLQTGVKEDIEYMKRELTSMYSALRKVGDVPRDQLDQQVKSWVDEVRVLSYMMEDIIEKFLVCVEGAEPAVKPCKLKQLMEKLGDLFAKSKTRYEISDDIKGIEVRVQEAADRHDKYKVNDVFANPAGPMIADPRLLTVYTDKKDLVGIDIPLKELANMLSDGHDDVHKQLKIISIFGFGGLGKTTLAKALQDKCQSYFDCSAFVPVGRKPSVKNLLNDILLAIDKNTYPEWDERQLIDELQGLLKNKRYFIVIDDIWDTETWDIVRCALVDNNCASRILTTTRILDVATKSSEVYRLEPLSRGLSEDLFHSRLFGVNSKCTSDLPAEIYGKILHRCGGVPLAIITTASLLVNKPVEFWSKIYNSIGFGHGDNKDVENTRIILLFSYHDLPCHLKTCLLHMSIYPEDHLIEKDSLIWLWVGEGFIQQEPGVGLYEIGERYLNELINKSMLLPVETMENGIITSGCRVHDMVLDMICVLAKEENFVTILGSNEQYTSSFSNARRLAIGARKDCLGSVHMLQVRSLNVMCCSEEMPSLSYFQVLRVLNLLGTADFVFKNNNVLEHLEKFVHLRYLGIGGNGISEVPEEIGYLKFLQVLDFGSNHRICGLPKSIGLLSQLKCLNAPHVKVGTDGIGGLKALEDLSVGIIIEPTEVLIFVTELGKLTELRKLSIRGLVINSVSSIQAWTRSLVKLQKIQVIDVQYAHTWIFNDVILEDYVPPQQLCVFNLSYNHHGPYESIKSSSLPNLSHLSVHVDSPDVDFFARFPGLVYLELDIHRPSQGHFLMGGAGVGLFPKLRVYKTSATPGSFLPGAMPSLEYLEFSVDVWTSRDGDLHFDCGSLVNLPMLQKVNIFMCSGNLIKEEDWCKAEETVRHAIDIHPSHPALNIEDWRGEIALLDLRELCCSNLHQGLTKIQAYLLKNNVNRSSCSIDQDQTDHTSPARLPPPIVRPQRQPVVSALPRHNRSPYLPILELELLRVELGSVSSRRATS